MAARRTHESSDSPNHHLWRNGRLWWVAFTVHLPPWHKERVRLSLQTDDIDEARRRRDELLKRYPQEHECTLSLRVPARAKALGEAASGAPARREAKLWRSLTNPADALAHAGANL